MAYAQHELRTVLQKDKNREMRRKQALLAEESKAKDKAIGGKKEEREKNIAEPKQEVRTSRLNGERDKRW